MPGSSAGTITSAGTRSWRLVPAFEMAKELPEPRQALPVLKVLYRNAQTMQGSGGQRNEALKPVEPRSLSKRPVRQRAAPRSDSEPRSGGGRRHFRRPRAPRARGRLQRPSADRRGSHLPGCRRHPLRGPRLAGLGDARPDRQGTCQTLLRQSVHFCMDRERRTDNGLEPSIRTVLPRLLDRYKLIGRTAGTRAGGGRLGRKARPNDHRRQSRAAADAVAAALAEGFDPEAVGEAISLAANHLLLLRRRTPVGRPAPRAASFKKAKDSVHGDSAGVHASDATNAWRNIARVSNPRNAFASLIVAAYNLGPERGQFQRRAQGALSAAASIWKRCAARMPRALVGEAEQAIRANDQALACAAVHRYGELDAFPAGDPRSVAEVRD